MTRQEEIELYKQRMTAARLCRRWKQFNDFKKHYDKLIMQERKAYEKENERRKAEPS